MGCHHNIFVTTVPAQVGYPGFHRVPKATHSNEIFCFLEDISRMLWVCPGGGASTFWTKVIHEFSLLQEVMHSENLSFQTVLLWGVFFQFFGQPRVVLTFEIFDKFVTCYTRRPCVNGDVSTCNNKYQNRGLILCLQLLVHGTVEFLIMH